MAELVPYVLVVDDSPDGREMLAEYLTFRGFSVVEAANGEAAVDLAKRRPPAIILMDLQMPGLGGWEATRLLKSDPATQDVVIVAVTAHALKPDEGIAREAGCDAFIAKPFDITAVGDAVGEVIQRGRSGLVAIDALHKIEGIPRKGRKLTRVRAARRADF
jgi:two-component system, cell cycle response regulator DivK